MTTDKRLLDVLEKAKKNAAVKQAAAAAILEELGQITLPLWDDDVRALPNGFLRSALYSAQRFDKNNPRSFLSNIKIFSFAGVEITYNGVELDQADLDVWETAIHILRGSSLDEPLLISLADFFHLMGKTSGGSMQRDLLARLTRLVGSTITIKQGQYSYVGGLMMEGAIDDDTKKLMIRMSPSIISLFQKDQFTNIPLAIKNDLKKQPIALFLYRFYSSHAAPHALRLETIHKLCRSRSQNLTDFKKNVTKALEKVHTVCAKHGESFDFEFRDYLLEVKKSGSASQQRHLEKHRTKSKIPNITKTRHSTPKQLNIDL